MIRMLLLAALLLALPARAQEESIVVGLSQSNVSITTDFTGSEILVYGAVKRIAPPPDGPPMHVIVTVAGPPTPVTVRRKNRLIGIWVNDGAVRVDRAPSFYAIATTGPLDRILSETEDLRHRISIPRAIRSVGISGQAEQSLTYVDALLRIRTGDGSYSVREGRVSLAESTLFRADVELPANLTEGNYRVRIFLTRGGVVLDTLERTIGVQKAGLERFIYELAQQQPLIYGIVSLMLAVSAGWGASALFQRFRS